MSMLTLEECELLGDIKYQSYITQIEAVLHSLEQTSQWADLITVLGKLNKVLLSNLRYPVIPRKAVVGKCLARCLQPSLPSSVHMKTLETYDIIFKCIGTQRLGQDLFVYSAGLIPVFTYADANVKSVLMTLFEMHFVGLGPQLRPGLNGLLFGLLPSLESGPELIHRTKMLLEDLCAAVGAPYFYTCIWECLSSCSSVHLWGTAFLLNHLSIHQSMEDQLHMFGLSVDLMVGGICACLQDGRAVVQRNVLDILLLALPVDGNQLTTADLTKVVGSAVTVIHRQDASLDRRLYAWLLGTPATSARFDQERGDSNTQQEVEYFTSYTKTVLVSALKTRLWEVDAALAAGQDGHASLLNLLEVLVGLLDKPEIGPAIKEYLLLSVFSLLKVEGNRITHIHTGGNAVADIHDNGRRWKVDSVASSIVRSFQPSFLWEFIISHFKAVCVRQHTEEGFCKWDAPEETVSLHQLYHLADFLLDVLALDVCTESTVEHLPDLLGHVISSLTTDCDLIADADLTVGLKLCSKIVSRIKSLMAGIEENSLVDAVDGASSFNSSELSSADGSEHFVTSKKGCAEEITNIDKCEMSRLKGRVHSPDRARRLFRNDITSQSADESILKRVNESCSEKVDESNNQRLDESSIQIVDEFSFQRVDANFDVTDSNNNRHTALKDPSSQALQIGNIWEDSSLRDCGREGVSESQNEVQEEVKYKQTTARCPPDFQFAKYDQNVDSMLTDYARSLALTRVKELSADPVASGSSDFGISGSAFASQRAGISGEVEECRQERPQITSAESSIENLPSASSDYSSIARMLPHPESLMQQCVESYKKFFHRFCRCKMSISNEVCTKCMKIITLSSPQSRSGRPLAPEDPGDKFQLESAVKDVIQTYKQVCGLLLDIASCSSYFRGGHDGSNGQINIKDKSAMRLPPWLQDLLVLSCHVDSFEVGTVSASTLLELIALVQSVHGGNRERIHPQRSWQSLSERRMSEVTLLVLLPIHLTYIDQKTRFYQLVASDLWKHMSEEYSSEHQRAAELFHSLHQITRTADICEDIICHDLVSESEVERVSAIKKFGTLWHLTRIIRTTEPALSRCRRALDRSMFVVLDSLKEESSVMKTLAMNWLTHVLERGDSIHVLQPLLMMMLHHDTARAGGSGLIFYSAISIAKPVLTQRIHRTSVDHVCVRKSKETDEATQAKISAIISKGGEIKSHLNHNKHRQTHKSTEDVKAYTLSSKKNQNPLTSINTHLSFEPVNPESFKLSINPFGSESSLDKLIFDGYDFPQSLFTSDRMKKDNLNDIRPSSRTAPAEEAGQGELKIHENNRSSFNDMAWWNKNDVSYSAVMKIPEIDTTNDAGDSFFTKNQIDVDVEQSYIPPNLDDQRGSETESVSTVKSGSNIDVSHVCNASCASHKDGVDGDFKIIGSSVDPKDFDLGTDIHSEYEQILLYSQRYDHHRIRYAMSTLQSILQACPRLFVTAMATTSVSSVSAPDLVKLLGRHRKSVFGESFFQDLPSNVTLSHRSSMLVEVVISLCLCFVRSHYPNHMTNKLTTEDLLGNRLVHILSIEVLTSLMSQLSAVMKDSGNSFLSYIFDLLSRCKLRKYILHFLLASVYNRSISNIAATNSSEASSNKSPEIAVEYNESSLDPAVNDMYQVKLLQAVLAIIVIEHQMLAAQGSSAGANMAIGEREQPVLPNVQQDLPTIQQEKLLTAVLSTLRQHGQSHLHCHWVGLVNSALPYMGTALATTVLSTALQLCSSLETMAWDLIKNRRITQKAPPDHLVTTLEGLTTMCHYCLLDNTNPVSICQPAATSTNQSTGAAGAGRILTNLIQAFSPVLGSKEPGPARDSNPVPPMIDARGQLLNILPRIVMCMALLWKAVISTVGDASSLDSNHLSLDDVKSVRHHILELLSPLSLSHGSNLLAAFAMVWNDRRQNPSNVTTSQKSHGCADQLLLVELVGAIRVLPTDTFVQTVKQVIKYPPQSQIGKKDPPLDVSLLQLFLAYIHREPSSSQLLDSWPSLLSLLREGLQLNLSPPAQFLLLQILHEFVQRTPAMEGKKNQSDLQDICQKTLDSVCSIARSSLNLTVWLRRAFAVKPGPQNEEIEACGEDAQAETNSGAKSETDAAERGQASESTYSVQALLLLAENIYLTTSQLMAKLLDMVYSSASKHKAVPFLSGLLNGVFPYLRHHSTDNLSSFQACSHILSSISGYQYTRRAWRKDTFEMLMDSLFFQMNSLSIAHWRVIIDDLMTHDRTTFKDLMGRVSVNQAGSLNLFSTKEQECELRAQVMKRLAFVIFCSEVDHYQRAMPEIQERLSEYLRLPQSPNIMSSVFLCFRVLILRMSPHHLTSLWPTIVTEMVQVLLQIEQELSADTEEFMAQVQKIADLDNSWSHLGDGLNARNNPAWLQLYLNVCKLLDACIIMPADRVPQFQLYRWAFIGTAKEEDCHTGTRRAYPSRGESHHTEAGRVDRSREESHLVGTGPEWQVGSSFLPHVCRLSRLLNNKLNSLPSMVTSELLTSEPGRPLLTSEPGLPLLTSEPGSSLLTSEPGPPLLTSEPGPPLLTSEPGPPLLTSEPGHAILASEPGHTILASEPDHAMLPSEPGRPVLTLHRLRALSELQPFFNTMCHSTHNQYRGRSHSGCRQSWRDHADPTRPTSKSDPSHGKVFGGGRGEKNRTSAMSNMEYIEHLLNGDFLEPLS